MKYSTDHCRRYSAWVETGDSRITLTNQKWNQQDSGNTISIISVHHKICSTHSPNPFCELANSLLPAFSFQCCFLYDTVQDNFCPLSTTVYNTSRKILLESIYVSSDIWVAKALQITPRLQEQQTMTLQKHPAVPENRSKEMGEAPWEDSCTSSIFLSRTVSHHNSI